MIRHFVFFTAQHDGNIEPIRKGLQILKRIPHAQRLEIALNRKSEPTSREVDVVVYGEFADDDALTAYKAHEFYAESVRRVKPLREMRWAADYDMAQAVNTPDDDA
ncbi:Dabb family protein [Primorskyibacter flagellatus]|uniref:Stress responsive A/B Barrel Domain n=1 Tax=Primorskyibacter flagellatus TaxID=1387277 RepID=A0A1W2DEI9_9RHOB|nr:Dabb family protein [Primorskyibacter flagellatus]SMC95552.1 Stress responsive A/B Barrel Domain [Primorskyibacter flagellatus]